MEEKAITDAQREMIKAVRSHAMKNYERGSWSYVVEAYDDDYLLELIGKAKTCAGAIRKVASEVNLFHSYASDIRGSEF